jgi:Ca-activated chloride channel homolog
METVRKKLPILLVISTCLSLCTSIFAQEQSPQKQAGPAVRFSLIITDRSKHSVDDLTRDSISILEDKVPQTVSLFSKDDRPVDYAVVIDTTGSFRKLLDAAVETARFLVSNNRDLDETFIERFISSDKIETIQEFTSDKTQLLKGLRTLYVEGGQSAVIDGVYEAASHTADYHPATPERRKALVLISDGEDRASYYTENQLVQLLREKDVQVFAIGIVAQLDDRPRSVGLDPKDKAEKLLTLIARETGGRVFFPKTTNELRQAASEIVRDLHTQYLIGYQSTNTNSKETFRKVEVKIAEAPGRDKPTAITRPGYFVNPPDTSAKEKDKKKPKG